MGSTESNASQSISDAENALSHSYLAVLKAENSGANVSALSNSLNSAAKLLNEAEVANANENYDSAVNKSDQSITVSNEVSGNASVLYDSASANSRFSIFYTVAFPVGGAAAFVLAVFLFWGWYSRRYEKKLLKMKVHVDA
jgi:hypothetical protein